MPKKADIVKITQEDLDQLAAKINPDCKPGLLNGVNPNMAFSKHHLMTDMKNYLYEHWADSTLILAIAILTLLLSYFSVTPWPLFLIWMQFPIYLLHQFEEHVYPGNFKAFINDVIFKSGQGNYPLNSADVFWINILAIWFLFPIGAILAQHVSLGYGVLLPVFGLFNASLHILFFLLKKRYNPGLLVSVLLNYPTGIYTLYILRQNHITTTFNVIMAVLVTVMSHAIIIIFAKNKMAK